MPLFYNLVLFILILLILTSSPLIANSNIIINGQSYSSGSGSISVVNGIVIDGQNISSNGVRGNNNIVTDKRNLSHFNQLQVGISADIEVVVSNSVSNSPHIEITSDENIVPLIISKIKNNRLLLSSKSSFHSQNTISIKIFVSPLNKVVIDSAANLNMQNIAQQQLSLIINGTGDINITGRVMQLKATINGAGDMDLAGLQANTAKVSIRGSGDISVYVSQQLQASISGSGDINYSGNPQQVKKSITGSGDIDTNE